MGVAPVSAEPAFTVVTVLHNNSGLIPELAATVMELGAPVIFYDSASTDGSADAVRKLIPGAKVVPGANLGFGHGNNIASGLVDTEYILFLNSDARIGRDSLETLAAHLDCQPSVAAAQPLVRAWNWPLVTAGSGVFVTPFGEAWDSRFMHLERTPGSEISAPPAVTAAVSLWKTSAFREVGGFDEGYFMYFEDADLCLRASAAGWGFSVLRGASALHRVGSSSRRRDASLWELASSVRLARRFIGAGRLPRGFISHEIRIELGLLSRRRPWLGRLRTVVRALRAPVTTVGLSASVRSILHGSPEDQPFPRPGPLGPGFRGKYLAPFGVFTSSGGAVRLYSPFGFVSGGVCNSRGETTESFGIEAGKSVSVRLLNDGGLSYIFCDRSDSRLEVCVEGERGKG